jgi:hypothetical protein
MQGAAFSTGEMDTGDAPGHAAGPAQAQAASIPAREEAQQLQPHKQQLEGHSYSQAPLPTTAHGPL